MRDKIIRIHWSKALELDEAINNVASDTQGLYYISRMFGKKETTLYLGIATKNNREKTAKNMSIGFSTFINPPIYVRNKQSALYNNPSTQKIDTDCHQHEKIYHFLRILQHE